MRLPEQTVETAPGGVPTQDLQPLVGALQGLYRAYQKTTIYPADHPAVPEALNHASRQFDMALGDRTAVVGVARDSLWVGNAPLAEATGSLRSLAIMLHDLDVAAIEFRSGLDSDELKRFVAQVGTARRESLRGQTLAEICRGIHLDHVRVVPIDYGVLHFADGAREHGERSAVWENLVTMLTEAAPAEDVTREHCPDMLATEVMDEIETHEGAGVGLLRRNMRLLSHKISAMESDERTHVRERLTEFVGALNPQLRADLLRVDPQLPGESLTLMTMLADVIPEPDLLEALQEIDRVRGRVPGQLLTLMNKLVRLSRDRPSLQSGLEDVMDRWGLPRETVTVSDEDLRGALEELFRKRQEISCNPDSYQSLLDDLACHDLAGTQLPIETRYRDPRNVRDLQIHAGEIAVYALGRPDGEEHRARLLGYVEHRTPLLIEAGKLDVVRDAAVAARTVSLVRTETRDSQRAAKAYLAEFGKPERVQTILDAVADQELTGEAARSLLRLGGDEAAEGLLDFLSGKLDDTVRDWSIRRVAEQGPETIARLVEARSHDGWHGLRPLLPVLALINPEHSVPILEQLTDHDEEVVRGEARFVLSEVDGRPGAGERHLRRVLSERNAELVSRALARLNKLTTRRALAMLCRFATGQMRDVVPGAGQRARAIDYLAAGREGRELLCRSLVEVRSSVFPRQLRVGLLIAAALEPHRQDEMVDSCLRRWRLSPSKLLSHLLVSRSSLRAEEQR